MTIPDERFSNNHKIGLSGTCRQPVDMRRKHESTCACLEEIVNGGRVDDVHATAHGQDPDGRDLDARRRVHKRRQDGDAVAGVFGESTQRRRGDNGRVRYKRIAGQVANVAVAAQLPPLPVGGRVKNEDELTGECLGVKRLAANERENELNADKQQSWTHE